MYQCHYKLCFPPHSKTHKNCQEHKHLTWHFLWTLVIKLKKSETIIPLYCKMGGKKVSLSISCFYLIFHFESRNLWWCGLLVILKPQKHLWGIFGQLRLILKAPILTWFFCYFNARCCVTAKWNWNNPFRISHTSLTSAHSQWDLNYQNHMAANDLKKISISFFFNTGHIF